MAWFSNASLIAKACKITFGLPVCRVSFFSMVLHLKTQCVFASLFPDFLCVPHVSELSESSSIREENY